jgi:hypothetical protein
MIHSAGALDRPIEQAAATAAPDREVSPDAVCPPVPCPLVHNPHGRGTAGSRRLLGSVHRGQQVGRRHPRRGHLRRAGHSEPVLGYGTDGASLIFDGLVARDAQNRLVPALVAGSGTSWTVSTTSAPRPTRGPTPAPPPGRRRAVVGGSSARAEPDRRIRRTVRVRCPTNPPPATTSPVRTGCVGPRRQPLARPRSRLRRTSSRQRCASIERPANVDVRSAYGRIVGCARRSRGCGLRARSGRCRGG